MVRVIPFGKVKKLGTGHCLEVGGGLVQIGEGMIFMQGKKGGGAKNLCIHIRELCYTMWGKGEGQKKMCFTKRKVRSI